MTTETTQMILYHLSHWGSPSLYCKQTYKMECCIDERWMVCHGPRTQLTPIVCTHSGHKHRFRDKCQTAEHNTSDTEHMPCADSGFTFCVSSHRLLATTL